MVRNKFPISWGDTGTQPPDGDDFQSGEKPDAQIFDWYWYNTIQRVNQLWDEFERLDADDDGTVDEADYALDADSVDGNGFADIQTWVNNNADVPNADYADTAGDADTLDGVDGSGYADDPHGNEAHDSTYTTLTEVNNNADVPNADHADVSTIGEQIEVRTDYPSSPADGRVVLRSDLT